MDSDCRPQYILDRDNYEPTMHELICCECGAELGWWYRDYNGDIEFEFDSKSHNTTHDSDTDGYICDKCFHNDDL